MARTFKHVPGWASRPAGEIHLAQPGVPGGEAVPVPGRAAHKREPRKRGIGSGPVPTQAAV